MPKCESILVIFDTPDNGARLAYHVTTAVNLTEVW